MQRNNNNNNNNNDINVSVKCGDNVFSIFSIRRMYLHSLENIENIIQLIDKFRRLFRTRNPKESLYNVLCQFFDQMGYTSFNYFHIHDLSAFNITFDNAFEAFDNTSLIVFSGNSNNSNNSNNNNISFPLIDSTHSDLEYATRITFALLC